MSLYKNINLRKSKGISRPKKETTIDPKTYKQMKEKKGGFKPKKYAKGGYVKKYANGGSVRKVRT
tara:strand:- start:27 stop:221 length:195 start_codon:yes stop_codon:yes gene_type:complete